MSSLTIFSYDDVLAKYDKPRQLLLGYGFSISEQSAIAEVLTMINVELAVLEQRRKKTRARKQAMMQEPLTRRMGLA